MARKKHSLNVTVAQSKVLRNVKNKKVLIKKRVTSKKCGKKNFVVKCDHCKKKFGSVSAKNVHMESKHKGRRFICQFCNEDFHSKFAYGRHLDRHHKDEEVEAIDKAENSVYITDKIEMTPAAKDALIQRLRTENKEKNQQIAEYKLKITELEENLQEVNTICAKVLNRSSHSSAPSPSAELHPSPPNMSSKLVPDIAINAFEQWVTANSASENLVCNELGQDTNLIGMTHQDLNNILKCFIEGVRKPNGEPYAPDTIYNLILSIQKYLYENDRDGNIVLDPEYIGVAESLNKVLDKFHSLHEGLSK